MLRHKESRYAHWRGIMEQFEKSGLSQENFCQENNVSFRKFKYYRYRIQLENKKQCKQTFAAVKIEQPKPAVQANKGVSITLPNQLTVTFHERMSDSDFIALIQALKQC